MSGLPSWTIPSGHLDKLLAPCKGSQNSLGFWIPCCEFQIPGTRFQIAYQWNLDSRLQPLVAFQITGAVFRMSKSKIRNPQAKKSRILDSTTKSFLGSGFPNTRQSFQCTQQWSFFLKFLVPQLWEENFTQNLIYIKICFLLTFLLNTVPATSFPCRKIELKNHPYRQETVLEFCVRFASIKLNEVLHSSNKYHPLDMYQYYVILCTTIHGYFQMHKMWTAKHAQLWPSNYSLEMLSVAIKYCECPLVPWNYCTSSMVLRRRKLTHRRDPRVENSDIWKPENVKFHLGCHYQSWGKP